MTDPAPTTLSLDELMDLDPLSLTKSPEALTAIVDYHRKRRAERAGGTAKRPAKEDGPKISLDLLVQGMTKNAAPATPVVKRRI